MLFYVFLILMRTLACDSEPFWLEAILMSYWSFWLNSHTMRCVYGKF